MIDPSVPIIILHGLGNRAWTLILLEYFLNWHGYSNVYRPQYNADTTPERAAAEVTTFLTEYFKGDRNQSFVVIGNSMGGLVAWR
jgi:pimeloyl-ACP methyl ester carboxylesterase